jgi:hypothetical protein
MRYGALLAVMLLLPSCASAQDVPRAETVAKFPFLQIDARQRVVRVECEAIRVNAPLEFFLCASGTNEHEAVLRSKVKPSHLHAALLAIGLKPGEPVQFNETTKKWIPPHGPPLSITAEFEKDGKSVSLPAYRLMRDIRAKREMPPMTWIFAGSRVMENGRYAADTTGYLISVVNFDYTVIDIPKLASNANETLEWETNLDVMPPQGTKVTLVITPAGRIDAPATQQSGDAQTEKIDQPLITISADGKIEMQGRPIENGEQLLMGLKNQENASARVRVAVANAIEQNETARDVINVLSRSGIKFIVIPQAMAGPSAAAAPATRPAAIDQELIRRVKERWEKDVVPHGQAVRDAARTHYQIVVELRKEQQRLIDEADQVQRLIDQYDKEYQNLTAPGPE